MSDPQHPARLLRALSSFREESRFCDAHLVLEGEEEAGLPARCAEGAAFEQEYARAAAEIRRLSDQILQEAALNGFPAADRLTEYRQAVLGVIRALDLSDVYASEAE